MTAELCESCGERPASIQYIEVVGGEKRARAVCDACISKEPLIDPGVIQKAASHLVEQVLQSAGVTGSDLRPPTKVPDPCPGCQLGWPEFKENSRLGCQGCYQHFQIEVEGVLERLHGSARHAGRSPLRVVERETRRAKQQVIRAKLDAAVMDEDYERAARLRDDLRSLGADGGNRGTV